MTMKKIACNATHLLMLGFILTQASASAIRQAELRAAAQKRTANFINWTADKLKASAFLEKMPGSTAEQKMELNVSLLAKPCGCRPQAHTGEPCIRLKFAEIFNDFFRNSKIKVQNGNNLDVRAASIIDAFLWGCATFECYEAASLIVMPISHDLKIVSENSVDALSTAIRKKDSQKLFANSKFLKHFTKRHCFDKPLPEDLPPKDRIIMQVGMLVPIYEVLSDYKKLESSVWEQAFVNVIMRQTGSSRAQLAEFANQILSKCSKKAGSYKSVVDNLINAIVQTRTRTLIRKEGGPDLSVGICEDYFGHN